MDPFHFPFGFARVTCAFTNPATGKAGTAGLPGVASVWWRVGNVDE